MKAVLAVLLAVIFGLLGYYAFGLISENGQSGPHYKYEDHQSVKNNLDVARLYEDIDIKNYVTRFDVIADVQLLATSKALKPGKNEHIVIAKYKVLKKYKGDISNEESLEIFFPGIAYPSGLNNFKPLLIQAYKHADGEYYSWDEANDYAETIYHDQVFEKIRKYFEQGETR